MSVVREAIFASLVAMLVSSSLLSMEKCQEDQIWPFRWPRRYGLAIVWLLGCPWEECRGRERGRQRGEHGFPDVGQRMFLDICSAEALSFCLIRYLQSIEPGRKDDFLEKRICDVPLGHLPCLFCQIEKKLQKMETAIARAKSLHVECSNVDKKFRQLVDLTEDEANFHTKQSAFLYQLAVQTMPKSLHCLSMRLTVEYFHSPSIDTDVFLGEKFVNPSLYHYVVFSKNVLASSVVINSTVSHAKESRTLVFHVLTDQQNYFAMKLWFSRNTFGKAAVEVLNVEEHRLDIGDKPMYQLSLPEEFRISFQNDHRLSKVLHWTIYLSMFSYSHYLLPGIFENLDKLVILDDDVLVQQDLSALWSINMNGKVNGAVEYCAVELGQLSSFLSSHNYNKKSCVWMSGLNIVDLARWRELNLTGTFRRLTGELKADGGVSKAVASRASLLTFQDLVYALDPIWVLSGLGHDYRLGGQAISKAAVLHYNGNMKPWLELGIPRYRGFWTKFLNREDMLLRDCNVIP
ncbi:Probable galacturonosyltransferase 7 [Dionaea muscipula]